MSQGPEWHFAERPAIEHLQAMDYRFVPFAEHAVLRDGENQVLFRTHLIEALMRINGIDHASAEAAYGELAAISDNEAWLKVLRGDYSRKVARHDTRLTLRVIDFLNPSNNTFTVTHQLRVKAEKTRKPDIVIYVNGIPLVVIEAKSPLNIRDKTGEAFEQIKQYEQDIPRLFFSNVFNVVTDGALVLYGATGAKSKYYAEWRDPWPKTDADFADTLAKGLWCLLEPSRLLDLIAHYTVFEKTEDGTIKKICRYQQFRAVNRIVGRVIEGKHRQGLIWHTQGSGKSLTMVFAALKLKTHRTIQSAALTNPNILVLTDRVDLHSQISGTFIACGLTNPTPIENIRDLHALIGNGKDGHTALSTIFKFQGSKQAIANSENWIVMVDEAHRTQEKDLGAYLRATLPDARFFGFTGTPVKKDDKDTYANFGVVGENYLDKYGIDDAVADGATVPIYYTGRKTDWHIDEAKIDILFDTWFAELDDDRLNEIKKRGVRIEELVKHPRRIELIVYDIWTHFKAYARPDGFKAQIVAIDREAVILYKQALTKVIAEELQADGMDATEALTHSDAMSACVYSINQEDGKPSEDAHKQVIRDELKAHYVDADDEKLVKKAFGRKGEDPQFLIVCDKLLTGFDCPIESVMYLDKPLREHGLLQAIARTNRVSDAKKRNGLIVDYIGVSANLEEALATYRADDVKNAMRDLDDLRNQLRAAHALVAAMMKPVKRKAGDKDGLKAEYDTFVKVLGSEDKWFEFKARARDFIALYETLSPDLSILEFTNDLKWVANFLLYGTQVFEKRQAFDQTNYSEKIREMLDKHLEATGLSVTVKLRHITDPDFWNDFETDGKTDEDLITAAIRKTTELRKTVTERIDDSPHQYGKFSERLRQLLEKLESAQLSWADKLKAAEELAKDISAEDEAHADAGLSAGAYGILQILNGFGTGVDGEDLAIRLEGLYTDPMTAPAGWWEKDGLRKNLRQQVRAMAHQAGLSNLKEIPEEIEAYALKHFSRQ
ncbi:type I restriction endonuclease subunit R [Rhizobium brockwellii]|uniref:Type I restriction enzyme endonuclease subunit n=1 Tax=Rhizobium brockwellii TaxID=3019932 RepID=A0ABU3YN13_9HYPH|nr:type I restriction endonuclease subunit R [Rhizobium brockwellii]MDV4180211.1 type I restriction endonuclease subunit R [Rhizobium brockwellii]MDV4187133.1 type I restriction endonuclease subunit R [Rhizobium brockwellii]